MNPVDKVALITGGTSGIGKETAFQLSRAGINVTIVGRIPEKCASIAQKIQKSTDQSVEWIAADLSTLNGIIETVENFKTTRTHLNILINNAGALFNRRALTEDGIEKTFALNHLNYFLLTILLMDHLSKSSPARIINVSSVAHFGIKKLDFENLQGEKSFNGWEAYSRSKLCNLLFTYELERYLSGSHIKVNALHPGYINTDFGKNNGFLYKFFVSLGGKLFAKKPEHSGKIISYLSLSPELEGTSGKYFRNFQTTKSSPLSYDESLASQLWQKSLELTNQNLHRRK